MYICVGCKRQMVCDKNGVGADFGRGHVYPGDRYRCKTCGTQIIATNPKPIFDGEYRTQDEYLQSMLYGDECDEDIASICLDCADKLGVDH